MQGLLRAAPGYGFISRYKRLCEKSRESKGTPATTLNKQDMQRNIRAVAHCIAQQELEGLKVPEATVGELQRVARGEIDTDEAICNIQRRTGND